MCSAEANFKAGRARRVDLPVGIPAEKVRFVLQKDRNADLLNLLKDKINRSALQALRRWFLKKRPVCPPWPKEHVQSITAFKSEDYSLKEKA